MKLQEHIPLAPFTTFGVGGNARFFAEAHSEEEVVNVIKEASIRNMPLYTLGAGSNILVPDFGVEGIVLKISLNGINFKNEGNNILLIAGAGTLWEKVVDTANLHEAFGIENLAGIPGTIGGAAVQNIGAYGAEFANVFEYADVVDIKSGIQKRINYDEAAFGYRSSFFKTHRELIIVKVALRLAKTGTPDLSYPDLARLNASGVTLATPKEISSAVRSIRTEKFPRSAEEGTAGSFFKNPFVAHELANSLVERFPGLPMFSQVNGSIKISLAWLLDHALSLKGYANASGSVRLYEKQPLVIVARTGATSEEIENFADEITKRVFTATGITIEREVETFGT
jgi:UDP-N-acetylmuramate dehydrogenase